MAFAANPSTRQAPSRGRDRASGINLSEPVRQQTAACSRQQPLERPNLRRLRTAHVLFGPCRHFVLPARLRYLHQLACVVLYTESIAGERYRIASRTRLRNVRDVSDLADGSAVSLSGSSAPIRSHAGKLSIEKPFDQRRGEDGAHDPLPCRRLRFSTRNKTSPHPRAAHELRRTGARHPPHEPYGPRKRSGTGNIGKGELSVRPVLARA